MHDIGKLTVPRTILYKPAPLTAAEWMVFRAHPETGAWFAEVMGADQNVVEAVRQHHERLDGSGYPRGLAGDEITSYARILAVADVYCAMTQRRPYRSPLRQEDALEFLRNRSLFDGEVVKALEALVNCLHYRDQTLLYTGDKLCAR